MNRLKILLIGSSLLLCYIVSLFSLQTIRNDSVQSKRYKSSASFIPPIIFKIIAGEFKGICADYALIEAASIIGKKGKITENEWNTIEQLFRQTIALDPYFEQSCHLIQGTLPWFAKRYEPTFALLEESKNYRYWDWVPGYFIGFDYFFFIKNNQKASEYLLGASIVDGAPGEIATFAARLAQRAGNNQAAIHFLKLFLVKEKKLGELEMIMERIEAHEAVDILERGIQSYYLIFRKYPERLQDLVEQSIITEIPANPYKKKFTYNPEDGSVEY